jgi:hypothetical protein
MDDDAQRIDRFTVDEDVDLREVGRPVAQLLVVHRGVALAAALELVEVVDDQLGEGHLEVEDDPVGVEVLHVLEQPAAVRRELHQRPDVTGWGDDAEVDPRLLDRLDVRRVRQEGRVVDRDLAAAVEELDVVLDRWRRRDEVEPELALEPLLDDLHVEQAEEAAAKPEPEGDRALRLVGEARVVEMELLEGVAEERIVLAADRVDPGEDEALRRLVAGQRLARRPGVGRQGVADLGVADALEPGRDVADLARDELPDRHELRPEDAELQRLGGRARAHQPDLVVLAERARRQPDVDDHALVGVVVAVEDQALDGSRRVALRRRDPGDDRLEDLGHPGSVLGRGEEDLLARDREDVLELVHDRVGVGRGQVDLVQDGDQGQSLAQGEMNIGEGLRLDPLGRVDDEDRALAGLEAVADLVGEVDMAGRVDQVQAVGLAVLRLVLEANGAGLDRDPLLALEVHGVEDLARHLPGVDRVRRLEEPVGEGRLSVIDVGDDREVAQTVLGDGHDAGVYPVAARPPRRGTVRGGAPRTSGSTWRAEDG